MQGAPADVVRTAVERGDPLSGTGGFAGELESGTLVRDVLGRYPISARPTTRRRTRPTRRPSQTRTRSRRGNLRDGATREVVGTLPDQLERDVLALRAAGVEPVVPLLCDRVVRAALRLPAGLLADGGTRKVALRTAAADLPAAVRRREKTAVQYGSDVARELDRLARRAGFKRRMDDHVGRYIDSLSE
jgi:asparagine synthetase B (glutamine-hydrolysing)